MTFTDLHKILDDENRKLSLDELKQVIYELKQDAFAEFGKSLESKTQNRQGIRNIGFYDGEQNAFQICLDLLEHANDLIERPCKFGDTVFFIYSTNQIEPIKIVVADIRAKTIDGELCWFVFDENGYGGRFGDLCKKDWVWYIGKDKSAAERKLREIQGK